MRRAFIVVGCRLRGGGGGVVSRVVRWKGEQVGEEGGGGVVVAEVRLKKGGGGSQRGSKTRVI